MRLRPYTTDDLPAVLDAWEHVSRTAHAFLPDDFFETEKHDIAHRWMPVADTTVVDVDGRTVGFVAMLDNEVGALFVHPDTQGHGYGRALLDHVASSRPYLELDVFEANTTGRAFYDKYGFEQVGRHTHPPTGEPQLRMRYEPATRPTSN